MSTPDLSGARWRKSSRSSGQGGDCVEVAAVPAWRKSSRSSGQGGACVEVAGLPAAVAVRDSKDPDGVKLIFAATDWHAFTEQVRASRHDLT